MSLDFLGANLRTLYGTFEFADLAESRVTFEMRVGSVDWIRPARKSVLTLRNQALAADAA